MRGASLAAIESEYRTHFTAFVRVAVAIAGGEEAGRDAVHDAFVSAIKGRRGYRGDGPLNAWLWRAVINSARRQTRHMAVSLDTRPEPSSNDSPDHSDLRVVISRMPERQRDVLFLRYFADLDYEGIAQALGMSPGTVGATLHAAHTALRSNLEVDYERT
jgi:RNA polymerase sigma-70 factor (ECF subfamily)